MIHMGVARASSGVYGVLAACKVGEAARLASGETKGMLSKVLCRLRSQEELNCSSAGIPITQVVSPLAFRPILRSWVAYSEGGGLQLSADGSGDGYSRQILVGV